MQHPFLGNNAHREHVIERAEGPSLGCDLVQESVIAQVVIIVSDEDVERLPLEQLTKVPREVLGERAGTHFFCQGLVGATCCIMLIDAHERECRAKAYAAFDRLQAFRSP